MEYSEDMGEEPSGLSPRGCRNKKERRRYRFSWKKLEDPICGPWRWHLSWGEDRPDALRHLKAALDLELGGWEKACLRPWASEEWAGGKSRIDLRISGSDGFALAAPPETEAWGLLSDGDAATFEGNRKSCFQNSSEAHMNKNSGSCCAQQPQSIWGSIIEKFWRDRCGFFRNKNAS